MKGKRDRQESEGVCIHQNGTSPVNRELQRELSVAWNNRMQVQQNQQNYSPVPQCSSDVRANLPRKTSGPKQTIATSNTNFKNLSVALKGWTFTKRERKLSNQCAKIISKAIKR